MMRLKEMYTKGNGVIYRPRRMMVYRPAKKLFHSGIASAVVGQILWTHKCRLKGRIFGERLRMWRPWTQR